MGLAATRNGKRRGCCPFIFVKGVESSLAQEQSITAIPFWDTTSLSSYEIVFWPMGERTTPWNLWERVSSLTNPSRQSFLPEHFLGSQWPKSWGGGGTHTSSWSISLTMISLTQLPPHLPPTFCTAGDSKLSGSLGMRLAEWESGNETSWVEVWEWD